MTYALDVAGTCAVTGRPLPSSRILAIDPGYSCGWAVASADGKILDCGACPHDRFVVPAGVTVGCIEKPCVYPKGRARPNDLITLAYTAGQLAERVRAATRVAGDAAGVVLETFLPRQWKGTIEKEKHHALVKNVCTTDELVVISQRSKGLSKKALTDLWDAVAFAKWYAVKIRVRGKITKGRKAA